MVVPTQGTSITQGGINTQGGTQSKRVSLESMVHEFIKRSKKLGDQDLSDVEPKFAAYVRQYFGQLTEERRKNKLFQYVISTSKEDRGSTLERYSVAWFNLHRLITDDIETHRLGMLRVILKSLEECPITVHSFVPVYNTLSAQISKCSPETLTSLLEDIQNRIQESGDIATRWKDCVVVIATHLVNSPRFKTSDTTLYGREYMSNLIYEWFGRCNSELTFRHLLSIASTTGLTHLVGKYINERILDGLQDGELRNSLSWKAVCTMEFVDGKMINSLLRALCTVWAQTDEPLSEDVIILVRLLAKLFRSSHVVSKDFLTIFRKDRSLVLRSEFGFLAAIAICGVDRHKTAALADFKKTFKSLFKLFEEHQTVGWMVAAHIDDVINSVEKITEALLVVLNTCDKETWALFGEPLYAVAKNLLDCASSKQVTIMEGRVADGCRLWMYAKNILKESLVNPSCMVGKHLINLIHFLSEVSSLGAALIVIDVIYDMVKFCSVDILNNWKLLEGIFEFVCGLRSDIAVSLIRSLFPIILHRTQLRRALFETIKRDLLRESSVSTSIPILLFVLKSTSQRTSLTMSQGQASQSFASFSTQELDTIGVRRAVDETLGLEIIGVLKRCMSLSAPTQAVLYHGMAEIAERNMSMIVPCLDLLLPRAGSLLASLSPETMVIATKSFTQLKHPLPQMLQSMECLMCSAMKAAEANLEDSVDYDSLVTKGNNMMAEWVKKAIHDDIHDLGVDKLSEWNPTSADGRSNLVFAHMMLSYYDILIEHVWRRVAVLKLDNDRDSLVAIIKRRREMDEVLNEKVVRRKEAKVGSVVDASTVDMKQGEILISASSVAQILLQMVPMEADVSNIEEVKEDIFGWAIDRAYDIGRNINQTNHPLHSLISSTNNLVVIASQLMDFYTGTDCAAWLRSLEMSEPLKTKALETYASILQHLAIKYGKNPSKIISIWHNSDVTFTQNSRVNTNSCIVRHVHKLITKVYPRLLDVEETNRKDKTKTNDMDKQGKAIIKLSCCLLELSSSSKTYSTAFDFTLKMLKDATFANLYMLRDILQFVSNLAIRAIDKDQSIARMMNNLADELVLTYSDEDEDPKYKFITDSSQTAVIEFLVGYVEHLLSSIKCCVSLESDFGTKDKILDDALCILLKKCDECCELVSRLNLIHTQFQQQKERIVKMLTSFFTGLETPVHLLLSNVKVYPEIEEWNCISELATLLKKKMQPIMAIVDEKVGILAAEHDKRKASRVLKNSGDAYVKFVKARESFQSTVLLLCNALKDDRLNLQIRNNSIGFRDFRIDLSVLNERLNMQSADDTMSPQPAKKMRKSKTPATEEPDNENSRADTPATEQGSAVY